MTIEIKDVEHLAGLARMKISDQEKAILRDDLEGILDYVSQVKESTQAEHQNPKIKVGDLRNVLRADCDPHEAGIFTEDMLKQAPSRQGNHFVVKKIL